MKLLQCGLLMRNASLVSIRLAGLPCATRIMSSDNESCEKSQPDLSGSPTPKVRGAAQRSRAAAVPRAAAKLPNGGASRAARCAAWCAAQCAVGCAARCAAGAGFRAGFVVPQLLSVLLLSQWLAERSVPVPCNEGTDPLSNYCLDTVLLHAKLPAPEDGTHGDAAGSRAVRGKCVLLGVWGVGLVRKWLAVIVRIIRHQR